MTNGVQPQGLQLGFAEGATEHVHSSGRNARPNVCWGSRVADQHNGNSGRQRQHLLGNGCRSSPQNQLHLQRMKSETQTKSTL